MKEKRVYSAEFKSQAVAMAMQPEASKAVVARSLGITSSTLAGWINNYKKAKGIVDPPKVDDDKSELVRLRRENKRKFKNTTDSNHNLQIAPNLLNREFIVDSPNKAWVSDITYVWTDEGWLYLAVFIDLFNRKVVGVVDGYSNNQKARYRCL